MNFMYLTFFILILVAVDQFLKYTVVTKVKPFTNVTLIPNFLDITYVENRGAAFGIFQNQRWFFIIFAGIMILIFIYLIKRKKLKDKIFLNSVALIIAGGIGNFIDRLLLGYVIDYIKLSFFSPVCNFSDYCITFGAISLAVYILFFYKDAEN